MPPSHIILEVQDSRFTIHIVILCVMKSLPPWRWRQHVPLKCW